MQIDKNSVTPLYRQLVRSIRNDIVSGVYPHGTQIPTETELSGIYKVSRATVRSAVSELVKDGSLIKKQGKGTFVASPPHVKDMNQFLSFTDICLQMGKTPSAIVQSIELLPAEPRDVDELRLPGGSLIIQIVRLRLVDGDPVILERSRHSSDDSYLLQEDLRGSLYEVLRNRGRAPTQALKEISLCRVSSKEAKLLRVPRNSTQLQIYEVASDIYGRPIHNCLQIICSERWPFKLFVHSQSP
ncbi:MAG: GntR family transcriptional regulator [Clostridiales Family XIII bacterium]|jgi:GntR family transcriptional regulator|nr:GntR family transcriptional regulator [Clostridiales Family XIII bacterium]